jgi:hypothetical protein
MRSIAGRVQVEKINATVSWRKIKRGRRGLCVVPSPLSL